MGTASKLIPANTFCIAQVDEENTKGLRVFNRTKEMVVEGLVFNNEESYCALVTEHAKGPLIIDNNLTHPLTKNMEASQFIGGCSFLGVPILSPSGEAYGSLCAFDHEYYHFEEKDVELFLSLATLFTTLLKLEESIELLNEAEEKSEQVLKEKSNLLASLSHEIRTPMNGVLGMTSLLFSTELTEEQNEYVKVIETSGQDLLSMMDNILEYAKMESDLLQLELEPFNISECINHVLQLFSAEAQNKGLSLYAELDSDTDHVLIGDSKKIRQIMSNLISNALKFTEEGEISVTVKTIFAQEDMVELVIEVLDTGVGIPQDRLDRLFHSFYQAHDVVPSHNYGGTGLGLSICKQLAELMGGELWLVSSDEQGSRFAFKVSLEKVDMTDTFVI